MLTEKEIREGNYLDSELVYHGLEALAEIERLKAEVDKLRVSKKACQDFFEYLIAGWDYDEDRADRLAVVADALGDTIIQALKALDSGEAPTNDHPLCEQAYFTQRALEKTIIDFRTAIDRAERAEAENAELAKNTANSYYR